jgi:hypothetical protein
MKQFSRHIENFTCEHCKADVKGNGYTNHCPKCLWSKCVDINPGDRASKCGGLMEPIAAEVKGGDYIITHKCEKCGKEKRQRCTSDDDVSEVIKISVRPI